MPILQHDQEHAATTGRSGLRYLFTAKHHGADKTASQWEPALSLDEEFSVFDRADQFDFSDIHGKLYGVLPDGRDGLRMLGTWGQQVAEFPSAREGEPRHGYPVFPVNELGPPNRHGQKCQPPKVVFDRMLLTGTISKRHWKRLKKGDHA